MPSPRPHILGRVRSPHAPAASGTIILASGIDQTRDARSPASKVGLPPHLVSAARVAFWCAIGCIALLIAAVATSGGGR